MLYRRYYPIRRRYRCTLGSSESAVAGNSTPRRFCSLVTVSEASMPRGPPGSAGKSSMGYRRVVGAATWPIWVIVAKKAGRPAAGSTFADRPILSLLSAVAETWARRTTVSRAASRRAACPAAALSYLDMKGGDLAGDWGADQARHHV